MQELEALQGQRYYLSLLLEASDIAMPLLHVCCSRLGDAVSWLLVKLIGRALGLVWRGIRQSFAANNTATTRRRGRSSTPAYAPDSDLSQVGPSFA